jgi:hypothetical protein
MQLPRTLTRLLRLLLRLLLWLRSNGIPLPVLL